MGSEINILKVRTNTKASSDDSWGDPLGRFLRMPDVEESVGIRKSKIYELIQEIEDPFPSPIHIGTCAVWIEKEVNDWKARRVEKSRERKTRE